MRGLLAPIPCLVVALALAGCMGRTAPVAMAPQSNLDTIAYGQSYAGPAPMPVAYAVTYMLVNRANGATGIDVMQNVLSGTIVGRSARGSHRRVLRTGVDQSIRQ